MPLRELQLCRSIEMCELDPSTPKGQLFSSCVLSTADVLFPSLSPLLFQTLGGVLLYTGSCLLCAKAYVALPKMGASGTAGLLA